MIYIVLAHLGHRVLIDIWTSPSVGRHSLQIEHFSFSFSSIFDHLFLCLQETLDQR